MNRILVTGGAGFIGSHIVDQLVDLGEDVVVVDSFAAGAAGVPGARPSYLNPRAEYIEGDINDPRVWADALRGVDRVCHQAARVGLGVDFGDVRRYVVDNDLGTATALHAMHDASFAGRLVLASSMVVYGDGGYECPSDGPTAPRPRTRADLDAGRFDPRCERCGTALQWLPVTEDTPPDPRNVYAATKLHQEHLCAVFGREHAVPVTALRYHNVYGPRLPANTPYAGVAALFLAAIDRGERPRVYEDGRQLRDFVHVDDVARANVLALTRPEPCPGAFNIASGTPKTVLDLAAALCAGRGLEPAVVGGGRLGDVRHIVASPARAERELGFRAAVGFEAGVTGLRSAGLRAGDG